MNDYISQKIPTFVKKNLPLIYLIIALFALRWTVVEPYVVPTGSMEPTLKPGDRLYALKCAYDIRFPFTEWILFRISPVKRGDVILFRNPENPSLTFVKRAVGLPGDRIEYRGGRLFINGEEIPKYTAPRTEVMYDIEGSQHKTLYLETLDSVKHYAILVNYSKEDRAAVEAQALMTGKSANLNPSEPVWQVPPDHIFAMGDNRDFSSDSRFWGFVPTANLKGRAMFIWFSSHNWIIRPERIGTLIQ
ncbi:MAG: signal peptidase I [Deltaproteobacteria bacterium]|nr:signal peptidase I [Deltaproteobacteria bacterium]